MSKASGGIASTYEPPQEATRDEVIAFVAQHMATAKKRTPNSTDNDFADRFVLAMEAYDLLRRSGKIS